MNLKTILISAAAVCALALSSCIDDDEPDYTDWQARNTEYVEKAEASMVDGKKEYSKMAPDWSPQAFILVKWVNDRAKTEKNLRPMDNSLVRVKYALDDIDGNRIDDSYSQKTYGDSIYQTKPMNNITGFWFLLTQMRVGDRVKCIMPANSAYGNVTSGTLPPYSTLIYDVELVSMPGYEVPL